MCVQSLNSDWLCWNLCDYPYFRPSISVWSYHICLISYIAVLFRFWVHYFSWREKKKKSIFHKLHNRVINVSYVVRLEERSELMITRRRTNVGKYLYNIWAKSKDIIIERRTKKKRKLIEDCYIVNRNKTKKKRVTKETKISIEFKYVYLVYCFINWVVLVISKYSCFMIVSERTY